MKITMDQNGSVVEIALKGRLDTVTAPDLEKKLNGCNLGEVDELIFDFAGLDYISSAGLRVLLKAHRSLKVGGTTRVINANDIVREVFEVTGFADIIELA